MRGMFSFLAAYHKAGNERIDIENKAIPFHRFASDCHFGHGFGDNARPSLEGGEELSRS